MSGKSKRGFASMDREKQKMIASKGGKAAHAKGTAHEFTPEEARAAGRKGGQAAHRRGTAHQFTPEEAREAGRKGGQSSHAGGLPATGLGERAPQSEGGENFTPQTPGNDYRSFQTGDEQNPARQRADDLRSFPAAGPEVCCPPTGCENAAPPATRAEREPGVTP